MSREFHEGNLEEVAVYSGLAIGHKYQFFGVLSEFREELAIFYDQEITPQIIVRAGAFSENALLNSEVCPAVCPVKSDHDAAGVAVFGPDDSHQLNNFHRRTSL